MYVLFFLNLFPSRSNSPELFEENFAEEGDLKNNEMCSKLGHI